MINLIHGNCMDLMKDKPDDYYDLAIVDPPYGIGRDGHKQRTSHRKNYTFKGWDNSVPSKEYFKELFRVSKNQVIWGANYFTEFLKPSMGWIIWDKGQRELTMSDGELAYSSFNSRLKIITMFRVLIGMNGGYIHPTQKPVALYKWLLKNYAKPGDRILDSHGGSFSHAIAVHEMNQFHQMDLSLDIIEIDKDYFDAGKKRYENHIKQLTIFSNETNK